MRTEELWEEESPFFCSPAPPQKRQDVTALLKKAPSHVDNIDKNKGLI